MSEHSVRVNKIVPYNSPVTYSDDRSKSMDQSKEMLPRKENPRLVRFVTGSGRKTKKKTRGMR
jgi:hypothetical protein